MRTRVNNLSKKLRDLTTVNLLLLNIFSGIFFGTRNLIFAASGQKALSDDRFCDIYSYIFVALPVISITGLAIYKHALEENSLTLYEKTIFKAGRVGAMSSIVNILRFDPIIVSSITQSTESKIAYAIPNYLVAFLAVFAEELKCIPHCERLFDIIIGASPNIGAWIGIFFCEFFMQKNILEIPIGNRQVQICASIMSFLFLAEIVLYAVNLCLLQTTQEIKKFLSTALDPQSEKKEKILWWANNMMHLLRILLTGPVTIVAIPNILSLSPSFMNSAHNTISQKIVFKSLSSVCFFGGVVLGLNNGIRKITECTLPCVSAA